MKIGTKASGVMLAATFGGILMSAQLVTAPSAHAACPASTINDPRTGMCWPQSQTTLGISGPGGICLPGRIGLCLSGLQNSPIPGATLLPRGSSWP
ncbi:MAG: hypothetical protein KDB71_10305 [Mycobacterium sp.]|nr:hypothetical protein [Mycobacterium sp.]